MKVKSRQIKNRCYEIPIFINGDRVNYVIADGTELDRDLLREMRREFKIYIDDHDGWFFQVSEQ